jgi:lipoprotein signal peptidase
VFLLVAAAGLAADLASKHLVFNSLLSDPSIAQRVDRITRRYGDDVPPDAILHELALQRELGAGVKLTLSTNPGVVFGLSMPRWLVGVATAVTVALVVSFFATADARAWSVHVALGCILAGALGNLYDRLLAVVKLPGDGVIRRQVRDFIDCSGLHYPWVFNVADVLLVVGVALIALHWLLSRRRHPAD